MTEVRPVEAQVTQVAKARLSTWLKQHGYFCHTVKEWTRWEYCVPGLWSAYAYVVKTDTFWLGILGMHIYDGGEVVCVSREELIENRSR